MSNKYFDKKIKTVVDNHLSGTDVDSFWASIESDVIGINARKKKKRKMLFLVFGLTIFALGSLFLSNRFFNENNEVLPIEMTRKQALDIKGNSVPVDEELVAVENKERKVQKRETAGIQNDNSLKTEVKQVSKSPFGKYPASNQSYLSDKRNDSNILFENSKQDEEIGLTEHVDEIVFNNKMEIPEAIEIGKMFLSQDDALDFVIPEPYYGFSNLKKVSRRKAWEFNVGIQGGVNFASRKIASLSTDSQGYSTLRNETESSKAGFQIGLKTGVKHHSGFSFSTGIYHTQIEERFKFRGSVFKQVFVENGLIRYEININNDTIPITGNFEYDQEIIYNKDFRNSYRLFELPILIGYQKGFDNWLFGIQSGIFANITLKTVGLIFTPTNEFAYLKSEQADYFQTNLGLSYYIGGEGRYLMNENISLTFSPHFRIFPKSFTNPEKGISQKYSLSGLNLGVDFKF